MVKNKSIRTHVVRTKVVRTRWQRKSKLEHMLLDQKLSKQINKQTNKRTNVVRTQVVRIKVMAPIKTSANSHRQHYSDALKMLTV